MAGKSKIQFRLSHLCWILLVAAAYFAGRYSVQHVPENLDSTNAFDRTEPVSIALVGSIDLDSDGTDDSAEFDRLIVRNGGKVTYSKTRGGKTTGFLSAKLVFLL